MYFIQQRYNQIHTGTAYTDVYRNYRNSSIKHENPEKHLYSKIK